MALEFENGEWLKALGRYVIIEMDPFDPVPPEVKTKSGIVIPNGNYEQRNQKKTQAAFGATVGTIISLGPIAAEESNQLKVGDRVQPRSGTYLKCFDTPVYTDCTLDPTDPINRHLIVIDFENIVAKYNI